MRVKVRKPLGLEDEEAAGYLEEVPSSHQQALPFKLVNPLANIQFKPPVVIAVNARIRQKLPDSQIMLGIDAYWQEPAQEDATPPLRPPVPPTVQQSIQQQVGRPTRKRKQTSLGDDMIPPDAIFKPFSKSKQDSGSRTSTELVKMHASDNQKQQRVAAPQHCMPTAGQSCPFHLVAPIWQNKSVPPIVLAAAVDISHLAKKLEAEERVRAAAAADAAAAAEAADALVMVRLAPRANKNGRTTAATERIGKQEKPASSKQRPPRPSRKPTPEPPAVQNTAASPDSKGVPGWHPGMIVHGGINFVDTVHGACSKPPPAVVLGTPPRWRQLPVRHLGLQEYSDDPVLASIQFAKNMARMVGQLPIYSGALQHAVNAEQRLYKERLQRAVFARRLQVVDAAEPEDQTATRMGVSFQAELPTRRPCPASPSSDELKWLEDLILEPEQGHVHHVPMQGLADQAVSSDASRAQLLDTSQQQLSAAVGSLAAISLGLETMGSRTSASWTEEEETALLAGMKAYGRDFHVIQQDYVPSRTVHDLIDYYYNVLKLKGTRLAVQWYQEKAQAAMERQAELDRLEAAREAEQQRRAERQEAAHKRRQLREALGWLRQAAKSPGDCNFNKTIVRDRAGRAAKLIALVDVRSTQ